MTKVSSNLIVLFIITVFLSLTTPLGFCYNSNQLSLLDSAGTVFFDPSDTRRFGVELEFFGLSPEETMQLIKSITGGNIEVEEIEVITDKKVLKNGKIKYTTKNVKSFTLINSSIGDIVIKPEFNEVQDVVDLEKMATEIASPPMTLKDLPTFQLIADKLKEAGCIGTQKDVPLGMHVTLEIDEGKVNNKSSQFLLDLMRNYLSPEHRSLEKEALEVPKARRVYIQKHSPEFMKRLMDPNYTPTMDQLYDDFIYRQTLELVNHPDSFRAWKLPIKKVKYLVKKMGDDAIISKVAKFSPVRITSALVKYRPNDYMTKMYTKWFQWIHSAPVVEFREFNNDFNPTRAVRQTLGLMKATQDYGRFKHDKLLSKYTALPVKTIKSIRKAIQEQDETGRPVIFQYMLGNPTDMDPDMYKYYLEYMKDYKANHITSGFIPENSYGARPLIIPGESVVFHRRHQHRFSLLGKYNPGLINHNIAQALENKYAEFKFWDEYAPGAIPETKLLKDVIVKEKDPEAIIKKINKLYPNGWVMKGAWDFATEHDIITDKTDIIKELTKYYESDFDLAHKRAIKKYAYSDPEDIIEWRKHHEGYSGWKISQMLEDANNVLVQKKINIAREFRIEVIAGKVLGGGSTVDRFAYQYEDAGRKDFDYTPNKLLRKAERYAQSLIDQLPEHLRGTPFALDIVHLKDGSFAMIESNPGGNSGFLVSYESSYKVLHDFLKRFPEMVKSKEVNLGMSANQQMEYLKRKFSEWGVDINKQFEGLTFKKDRIIDPDIKQAKVRNFKKSKAGMNQESCVNALLKFL